jgi:DNA 3'-phosphatase
MQQSAIKYPEKRRTLLLPENAAGGQLAVAFFDADNTLRETRSGKPSPQGRHDVIVHRQTFSRLHDLIEQKYLLAIVSNQAGIELGFITHDEVEEAMQETLRIFAENNIFFNYYDFADQRDKNRKPQGEMAWRLERKLLQHSIRINWAKSFMVGDAAWKKGLDIEPDGTPGRDHANSDRRFAETIAHRHPGFAFFHPRSYFKKPGQHEHE